MSKLYLKTPTGSSRPTPTWDSTHGKVIGQVAIIDMTKRQGRFVFWALRKIGVLR